MLVTRGEDGEIRAFSAICQHRGEIIPCLEPGKKLFRCPLHFWTYDLEGRLVGAPRMGDAEAMQELRNTVRLPSIRLELWHGFVFVNLDANGAPLAPTLAKLEPLWAGYEATGLTAMPPVMSDKPLPWNWKVHVENFTDAYHPEYVHIGTHDFAPSVMANDGVRFTEMKPGDNAIVRSTGLSTAQSTASSQEAKDFKVVITLENPPKTARPGLSATAKITTGSEHGRAP